MTAGLVAVALLVLVLGVIAWLSARPPSPTAQERRRRAEERLRARRDRAAPYRHPGGPDDDEAA